MPNTITNFIGQKLKLEMKKQEITSAELAKRADVKTSFIYDIISGKSANPSTVKLARVAEALHVHLDDLVGSSLTGQQRISKHAGADDYVLIPRITVDTSIDGSITVSAEREGESCCFRLSWIKKHLGADPEALRVFYVSGDSMEPTLCNHDITLIDTTRKNPSPPGIFLLYDGFGLVTKRLEYTSHRAPRIRIISDNVQYSISERPVEEVLVIGRVVWFGREI
jgi:phage repressor protein C with HTH and peptisase S24 domain